jgi:hypothetical protein
MACESQWQTVVDRQADAVAARDTLSTTTEQLVASRQQLEADEAAQTAASSDYALALQRADEAWADWKACMDTPVGGEPAPAGTRRRR